MEAPERYKIVLDGDEQLRSPARVDSRFELKDKRTKVTIFGQHGFEIRILVCKIFLLKNSVAAARKIVFTWLQMILDAYDVVEAHRNIRARLPCQLPLECVKYHLRTFVKQMPQGAHSMLCNIVGIELIDNRG